MRASRSPSGWRPTAGRWASSMPASPSPWTRALITAARARQAAGRDARGECRRGWLRRRRDGGRWKRRGLTDDRTCGRCPCCPSASRPTGSWTTARWSTCGAAIRLDVPRPCCDRMLARWQPVHPVGASSRRAAAGSRGRPARTAPTCHHGGVPTRTRLDQLITDRGLAADAQSRPGPAACPVACGSAPGTARGWTASPVTWSTR